MLPRTALRIPALATLAVLLLAPASGLAAAEPTTPTPGPGPGPVAALPGEPEPAWCTALECNPVYKVLKLLDCEVLPGTPLADRVDLGTYC